MPNTYTELRRTVVGTATSSVTLDLTGISGYTDLVLVINSTASGGALNPQIQFNGDTASNYSLTWMYGNGSAAFSNRYSSQTSSYIGYLTTTEPATFIVQVQNYSNSTTYKSALFRWNTANAEAGAGICLWRSTAAITSVTVKTSANNFAVGSTFSLYGIANADQGAAKATGGIITEDSQYWYHTFGASSAFIPKQSLTCDVLVVAGGGGGGGGGSTWANGGGGGAGGLLAFASQALTAISYNITVGGGGTGGATYTKGTSGIASQFGALTAAVGGGAGGGYSDGRASTGGSGGGGAGLANSGNTGAAGTSGQGSAGGNGFNSPTVTGNGGGGGGATGVGQAANVRTSISGGNGGAGSSAYSTWLVATGTGVNGAIVGGGGGGAGTSGEQGLATAGGGNGGGGNVNGVNASAYTGGGGGGCGAAGSGGGTIGGNGGSGVVIIRYAK